MLTTFGRELKNKEVVQEKKVAEEEHGKRTHMLTLSLQPRT